MTATLETTAAEGPRPEEVRERGRGRALRDLGGVSSVVVMALLYLSPALKDGFYFGPYDIAAGLVPGDPGHHALVHNSLNGDIVTLFAPWDSLDYHLIHAGQLPLWNPFNLLGLPQLFNFQSGVLSLPDLVAYLVPLRLFLIVTVLVKLLLAGLGTYVLCRVCGTRPLAASFGAISFMLSGGFSNWLGWSLSTVVAFVPWICAFAILSYRRQKARYTVGLALSVMFSFLGGFPEMSIISMLLVGLFLATAAVVVLFLRRASLAGALRCLGGFVAGALLAAPLLLPGEQLLTMSAYAHTPSKDVNLPISYLSLLVSPAYYGSTLKGTKTFSATNFYESVSYIGIIAIVLALIGLFSIRRRASVAGMAAFGILGLAGTYRIGSFNPVGEAFDALGYGDVHTSRTRVVAVLGVAVLGAVGLDQVLRRPTTAARRRLVTASVLAAGAVGFLVVSSLTEHLTGFEGRERFSALIWPCATAAAFLLLAVVVGLAGRGDRRRRGIPTACGLGILALQAAFLLFAGVGMNSYSHRGPPQDRQITTLRRLARGRLVGFDGSVRGTPAIWQGLGFYPNDNILYGVPEFAGHDPVLPLSYARTFPVRSLTTPSVTALSPVIMPDISSAGLARSYGISLLLVQPGRPLPADTTLIGTMKSVRLVRVDSVSRFRFVPSFGGRVLGSRHPGDYTWTVRVDATARRRAGRLVVLGLSDVPGFSVKDGSRTLRIEPFGPFEMAVHVPPGRSKLVIVYWPHDFTRGLELAGLAAAALWVFGVVSIGLAVRRRRLVSGEGDL